MSCTLFASVSRLVGRGAMLAVLAAPALAQTHANKANWTLADKFSNTALRPSLYSTAVQPHWIGKGDSMWYNWRDHNGSRFLLVYPKAMFDIAGFVLVGLVVLLQVMRRPAPTK